MPINTTPDQSDTWLRALDRARKERVRLWLTKAGWRARSAGSMNTYTLMAFTAANGDAVVTCSCPATTYRGACKHQAMLAVRLSNRGETVRLG